MLPSIFKTTPLTDRWDFCYVAVTATETADGLASCTFQQGQNFQNPELNKHKKNNNITGRKGVSIQYGTL